MFALLALPALAGGGKYALVIGLGGLGYMAVQILAALSGATILVTLADKRAYRAGIVGTDPATDLAVLEPVRDYKARHASTLLTFDAVVDAIGQIEKKQAK